MGFYNFTPLKRSFVPETLSKDREEKDYTWDSLYQAVCLVETVFRVFDHKTPLHLTTKSDNPHLLNDSIS